MSTPILLGKDINGSVTYELPLTPLSQKYRVNLTASTHEDLTIPIGMTRAFFSYSNGVDVHVDFGGEASVPSGSFEQTSAELNPGQRYGLVPGEEISFISDTTAYVYVTFFPNN